MDRLRVAPGRSETSDVQKLGNGFARDRPGLVVPNRAAASHQLADLLRPDAPLLADGQALFRRRNLVREGFVGTRCYAVPAIKTRLVGTVGGHGNRIRVGDPDQAGRARRDTSSAKTALLFVHHKQTHLNPLLIFGF
jgi:tRNA U34 5-methylaminomethyl-2-thiouridine-forming methyltransferase MnmC